MKVPQLQLDAAWLCDMHDHDLTFAAVQSGYAVTLYLQPSQKKACIGRNGVRAS